jgi:hypothetical protein
MDWETLYEGQQFEVAGPEIETFFDPETGEEVAAVWAAPAFEEGPEEDLWF